MTNNLHVRHSEGNVINNEAIISFRVTANDIDKTLVPIVDECELAPIHSMMAVNVHELVDKVEYDTDESSFENDNPRNAYQSQE